MNPFLPNECINWTFHSYAWIRRAASNSIVPPANHCSECAVFLSAPLSVDSLYALPLQSKTPNMTIPLDGELHIV